jgi:hypothetical protein
MGFLWHKDRLSFTVPAAAVLAFWADDRAKAVAGLPDYEEAEEFLRKMVGEAVEAAIVLRREQPALAGEALQEAVEDRVKDVFSGLLAAAYARRASLAEEIYKCACANGFSPKGEPAN